MKEVKLSRVAEAVLGEIFDYSIANWGPARAREYKRRLLARIRALARAEPPHARPCAVLMAGKRQAAGLGYVREGSHFIILRETAERIEIVDFLHQSRDLERLIDRLAGTERGDDATH